jgi:hypothetical protein
MFASFITWCKGLKLAFGGDEARLLLARHQVEILGRIALNAAHHLDLIVLLPRVETLDQFLEPLGAFFVELMREVDFGRCRSLKETGAASTNAKGILSKCMARA